MVKHISRKIYEVDGREVHCSCLDVFYQNGKEIAKLLPILKSEGGPFLYDPKTKKKLIP